ncbi:hypothetical protein, partial [uncultured Duncaniella sp.]
YALTIRVSRIASLGSIYGEYQYGENNSIKMSFNAADGDKNGIDRVSKIPAMQQFLQQISAKTWIVSSDAPMAPEKMKFTNAEDPSDFFNISLK